MDVLPSIMVYPEAVESLGSPTPTPRREEVLLRGLPLLHSNLLYQMFSSEQKIDLGGVSLPHLPHSSYPKGKGLCCAVAHPSTPILFTLATQEGKRPAGRFIAEGPGNGWAGLSAASGSLDNPLSLSYSHRFGGLPFQSLGRWMLLFLGGLA